MYEHVICVNTLNLTLQSSTPELRLLDSGLRVLWFLNLCAANEGEGGATQILHQSSGPENILHKPLHCSLTRKECSEKNRVMEIHNSILG